MLSLEGCGPKETQPVQPPHNCHILAIVPVALLKDSSDSKAPSNSIFVSVPRKQLSGRQPKCCPPVCWQCAHITSTGSCKRAIRHFPTGVIYPLPAKRPMPVGTRPPCWRGAAEDYQTVSNCARWQRGFSVGGGRWMLGEKKELGGGREGGDQGQGRSGEHWQALPPNPILPPKLWRPIGVSSVLGLLNSGCRSEQTHQSC